MMFIDQIIKEALSITKFYFNEILFSVCKLATSLYFGRQAIINNTFNQPSFLAPTSELHWTLKPNSDAVVTTKLFEVTDKIFFAVQDEIV